jgi:hypothetical protein
VYRRLEFRRRGCAAAAAQLASHGSHTIATASVDRQAPLCALLHSHAKRRKLASRLLRMGPRCGNVNPGLGARLRESLLETAALST